ncbi:hypothetical protein EV182_002667 [Spiromyces aspiralis]|uniref:Uncharacterized protein n=1 Tax=Spiromyces aspiralis TaxID=68401 RepID=A0ACC1HE45_9FUNG|nr:hypothetical protein EV182_002667 [Spiromyces aspiralis]
MLLLPDLAIAVTFRDDDAGDGANGARIYNAPLIPALALSVAFIAVVYVIVRSLLRLLFGSPASSYPRRDGLAAAVLFVPSTSIYPSARYMEPGHAGRHRLHIRTIIDDFVHNRIELRNTTLGEDEQEHGGIIAPLLEIDQCATFSVGFRDMLKLATRILPDMVWHSRGWDLVAQQQFYDRNGEILEVFLGPDRLSLVGCFQQSEDAEIESLEDAINLQIDRIVESYLQVSSFFQDDRSSRCHILDLSGMWGDLATYIIDSHHVPVDIMVSTQSQMGFATELARESGVEPLLRVHVGALSHDLPRIGGEESYTGILSLDATDWVGLKNLGTYFQAVHRLLAPDGLFLVQVTTADNSSLWSSELVQYHGFRLDRIQRGADTPMLCNLERMLGELKASGFVVLSVENITEDAAITMSVWITRLLEARLDERMLPKGKHYYEWLLYLAWTQSLLMRGLLSKHFILATCLPTATSVS